MGGVLSAPIIEVFGGEVENAGKDRRVDKGSMANDPSPRLFWGTLGKGIGSDVAAKCDLGAPQRLILQ
jgi:hypothetical protein